MYGMSFSTDGGKSLTGVRNGFVVILKEKINPELLVYHCIIHQRELCAQTFINEICKCMGLVKWIVSTLIFYFITRYVGYQEGTTLNRYGSRFPEIKAFPLGKAVHYPEVTEDQYI